MIEWVILKHVCCPKSLDAQMDIHWNIYESHNPISFTMKLVHLENWSFDLLKLKWKKKILNSLKEFKEIFVGQFTHHVDQFSYLLGLIDVSTQWSHVSLPATRNVVFAKLLTQMTRLRAQFPDYLIKTIRLDNAGEFTSHHSMIIVF